MPYSARVILDSVAPCGKRLTTLEATYPRFVHSELLTHRMLSRNSSSSRAIPVAKLMDQVRNDPAMPVYWGKNQRGMQAREELTGDSLAFAKRLWLEARNDALKYVSDLSTVCELHKQIANRLLEPWMFITVLVSATEFENFFAQRCHADAQPEMRRAADLIFEARAKSTPVLRRESDATDGWHLPFVADEEIATFNGVDLRRLSVARCARVSYLTHDGKRDVRADLELADKLFEHSPRHWSPSEHPAQALNTAVWLGNFCGWKQYRKFFDDESGRSEDR